MNGCQEMVASFLTQFVAVICMLLIKLWQRYMVHLLCGSTLGGTEYATTIICVLQVFLMSVRWHSLVKILLLLLVAFHVELDCSVCFIFKGLLAASLTNDETLELIFNQLMIKFITFLVILLIT